VEDHIVAGVDDGGDVSRVDHLNEAGEQFRGSDAARQCREHRVSLCASSDPAVRHVDAASLRALLDVS